MVLGVSEGFTKQLEIEGVGFKAAVQGRTSISASDFRIQFCFRFRKKLRSLWRTTRRSHSGNRQEDCGQVAADIRRYYPPEPYKGKGVRYAGEMIRRKEGKTVQ